MKFPRIIRLDNSDDEVYPTTAQPGEWAVTGSFMFLEGDVTTLDSKQQQALRSGFLGIESFGWSTLVEVGQIDDEEFKRVVEQLAQQFVKHLGAPNVQSALPMAKEEAEYAASSVHDAEPHTLFTLKRQLHDEDIHEQLIIMRPTTTRHEDLKIWKWEPE